MSNRSIYHNVYSLLKLKSKCGIFLFLTIIMFVYFINILITNEIKSVHEFNAVYTCEDTCFLQVVVTYDVAKKITKDSVFIYNNEELLLKDISFGEVIVVENSAIEILQIEISDDIFYDKQTITLAVISDYESLIKKMWNALRGGDEDA